MQLCSLHCSALGWALRSSLLKSRVCGNSCWYKVRMITQYIVQSKPTDTIVCLWNESNTVFDISGQLIKPSDHHQIGINYSILNHSQTGTHAHTYANIYKCAWVQTHTRTQGTLLSLQLPTITNITVFLKGNSRLHQNKVEKILKRTHENTHASWTSSNFKVKTAYKTDSSLSSAVVLTCIIFFKFQQCGCLLLELCCYLVGQCQLIIWSSN